MVVSDAAPVVIMTLPYCSATTAAVWVRPLLYGLIRTSTLSSVMSLVYRAWTRSALLSSS
jgi:hypothetical protein